MTYDIPVSQDHVRSFKDPNNPKKVRILHGLVRVADLPQDIPLDPDPRAPKIQGPVTKRIVNSLRTNDGRFHLLNRGITISAKEVDFDNKHGVLKLNIPDNETYGVIDGGHTYRAIASTVSEQIEESGENGQEGAQDPLAEQFVHLEVLVGIESQLADIAEARNFSVSLKAWTLAGYRDKFEWFLKALGRDYSQYVKISENDEEPVGILDLIQVMSAVNPTLYPASVAPVEAYKNAGKCLQYFIEPNDRHGFRKLEKISPDIVRLYDYVRFHWRDAYNTEDESGRRGRLGLGPSCASARGIVLPWRHTIFSNLARPQRLEKTFQSRRALLSLSSPASARCSRKSKVVIAGTAPHLASSISTVQS